MASGAAFLDGALTLALQHEDLAIRRLVGTVVLRWNRPDEEKTFLARLVRLSTDPRVSRLAEEIILARARLAARAHARDDDEALRIMSELNSMDHELGDLSRDYQEHLRLQAAELENVRASLPSRSGLLELIKYRTMDFKTGIRGTPRWAALAILPTAEPMLVDLGPDSDARKTLDRLLGESMRSPTDADANKLNQKRVDVLERQLANLERIYLAPFDMLDRVPFIQLKLEDGRNWEAEQRIVRLRDGRDLLRSDGDPTIERRKGKSVAGEG
jgi:hypothetical protein